MPRCLGPRRRGWYVAARVLVAGGVVAGVGSARPAPVAAGARGADVSSQVVACRAAALVEAIAAANASGGGTVSLAPGCTYTLGAPDNYWYGPNGLPAIASDIDIEGNGATIARAGGGAPFRFFYLMTG